MQVENQNKLRLKLLVALMFLLAILPARAGAQAEIEVQGQDWDANFRDYLTFTLQAESSSDITEVELLYRVIGQLATSRNEAEFTPGPSIEAEFTLDQTEPVNYMPPGTELEYWWKVTDSAGNELKTEKERIVLLDNRYKWEQLQNDRLTLYWYEGSQDFGQALYDRADEALDTLKQDMGITIENPIRIFIYGNHNDLLGAISTNAQEWTGGQAFTEHSVVVIGVAPSQLDWGLGAMTHEMTHLVIHQATDNPFGDLPRWLDEGIAVYNENQEELDEDFRAVFEAAVKKDALMTLRTLSSPFPADPMQANLAYGQSGAVVKFIIDTYGSEAMANLLDIFADGALYDEALEQALGENTDSLDNAFRISYGLATLPGTAVEAASASDSNPEPESVKEPAAEAATDNQAEVAAEEAATDSQAEAEASIEQASPGVEQTTDEGDGLLAVLPCVAGLLAMLIMGGVVYGVRPG